MKYVCVMFPYPSGSGLHIGHYYNYAVMDSYCRWLRYQGENVFQPFGYDSFGLPAENYARSIGGDPRTVTYENIDNFRKQIVHMNTEYEERLITSDPSYIKWTQWIFSALHSRGLAYKKFGEVNWCDKCGTVLANEQARNGLCERHGTPVVKKNLNQWYFKITDYKDRLIKNLDNLDYPVGTIKQQRVWLEKLEDWCVSRQRSWGCPIPIEGETDTLDTFVDSSFYYLRYLTKSDTEFLPSDDYHQVDLYVGGKEHACMHLIYARFIHMVLFDMGIVPFEEPFKKVIHQGMITYEGHKMSKSKGNTVSPDSYDSDALRMYLMFIGPYAEGGDWTDGAIKGTIKLKRRIKAWVENTGSDEIDLEPIRTSIDHNVRSFKFNKVISDLMIFMNNHKNLKPSPGCRDEFLNIVKNFAPDIEKF